MRAKSSKQRCPALCLKVSFLGFSEISFQIFTPLYLIDLCNSLLFYNRVDKANYFEMIVRNEKELARLSKNSYYNVKRNGSSISQVSYVIRTLNFQIW